MKAWKIVAVTLAITQLLLTSTHAQRIRVQGNKFLVGDNPIFMLGANTPWNNWNEFGGSFKADWWNTHFQSLHNSGCNCTRVWISCSGENASPGIDANGSVSPPTAQFWSHVEQLFQIAENNKIYLMIALISFDHTKEDNKNADAWRAMYTSAANRQSFIDNYVKPFLQKFGDSPWFWSIDVGNELDWVHENDGVPIDDVFDLAARVANAAHEHSEVLVTLGTGAGPKYLSPTYGTNHYSDAELQKLQTGAYLDFYDNHYYDWMKEWFSTPFDDGPSSWQIDEKPCLIGEYAASGHGSGYSPAECLQKAYELGWQGVMPWTSNGVDANGSLSDFGSAFKTWSDAHSTLVFPTPEENPGPFTLTVTVPQGGTISVTPQKTQYDRNDKITLTAAPDSGNELLRWSGDASGSALSVELTITRDMTVSAQFITAGEFIKNGMFDDGMTAWNLGKYEGGDATESTSQNTCQISISDGGTEIWHVQLLQAGLTLAANQTYILSFDAHAEANRSIYVAVGEAEGDFTKFLEKTTDLTTSMQSFSFEFTPAAAADNARVEFNIGNETTGVTLDNVSLKYAGTESVESALPDLSKCNHTLRYNAGTRHLELYGFSGNLQIEGFFPDGRRAFIRHRDNRHGIVSIPLDNTMSRMLLVRVRTGETTAFMEKILCR